MLVSRTGAQSGQTSRHHVPSKAENTGMVVLTDLSGLWIDAVQQRKPVREIILDLDSSVSETYG